MDTIVLSEFCGTMSDVEHEDGWMIELLLQLGGNVFEGASYDKRIMKARFFRLRLSVYFSLHLQQPGVHGEPPRNLLCLHLPV